MLEIGTFLSDRYEILEKIGAGGMSDVYKAKDHVLGREVAIKALKAEFSDDVSFVTKFRSEAQSAAGLEHPNIVNIYDVGVENGLYFIVMEYIEGITLKTYIEKKGQLNYKEVISIAIQVGRGIEAAHNKGIIHRDIKPQNIIISKEGKVKVTDFGIARATSGNTISADVMGSVHYSSPEQARNGYVNEQSDVYSLGIVMYEMAAGRVPFDGETAVAVAIQHLQGEMIPASHYAPEIPISLEKIIEKSTMKNPDRRYSSMGDLLVDLKKALINPDEDFVTIIDTDVAGRTQVLTSEQVEKIREESANLNSEAIKRDLDYDEDDDLDDDDDEDGDSKVNPKMERAITIMGIAAAVIIVLILVYIVGSAFGWINFGSGTTAIEEGAEVIEVPNIIGMSEDEAKTALNDIGLGYKNVGTASSDTFEEGKIVTQSAEAGSTVALNSTIEVTVSSGKGNVTMPNLVGMTEAEAITTIQSIGLSYSKDYASSADAAQGTVLSQSILPNGMAKAGDTVIIVVSSGNETVQVPDVVGLTQTEAVQKLEGLGLKATIVEQANPSVAAGKVISQGIAATKTIDVGESVSITVSTGNSSPYYVMSNFFCAQDGSYVLSDSNGTVLDQWTASFGEFHTKFNLTVGSGVVTLPDGSTQTVNFSKQ